MSDAWGPRAHPERCDEEFESSVAPTHQLAAYVWIALLLVMAGVVLWAHLTGR